MIQELIIIEVQSLNSQHFPEDSYSPHKNHFLHLSHSPHSSHSTNSPHSPHSHLSSFYWTIFDLFKRTGLLGNFVSCSVSVYSCSVSVYSCCVSVYSCTVSVYWKLLQFIILRRTHYRKWSATQLSLGTAIFIIRLNERLKRLFVKYYLSVTLNFSLNAKCNCVCRSTHKCLVATLVATSNNVIPTRVQYWSRL